MGYRFPGRKLTDRDCPDPELFRQQIAPAAEELAGRLNEHNVTENSFGSSRYASGMRYGFRSASVDANAHIDTNGTDLPDALDADAWQVPDDGDWHQVGSMSVTYTAAEHMIWAVGWCYYGMNGTLLQWQNTGNFPVNLPRVQFAIRFNGALMEESITGTERPDDGAPRTLRPIKPIETVAGVPAFRSLDYSNIRGTGAMSWQCRAVRVQAQFLAPQGTTTVELVARRVIADEPTVSSAMPSVYVYNRRLWAMELKLGETGTSSGQTVTVDYPDQGDKFNKAHTYDSQITPVITAQNALNMDAIRRFGLRKEHLLASGVLFRYGYGLNSGSSAAKRYPGFINTGAVGVSPNWSVVDDGAGLNCEIDLSNWNFTTDPGYLVVFGNVAFALADGNGNRPDRYGVFGIGFLYQSGATTLGDGTSYVDQAFINNPNIDLFGGAPVSRECYTDIPLFGVYDFRSAAPANGPVSKIRLLATGYNQGTNVSWENSTINAIIFRA